MGINIKRTGSSTWYLDVRVRLSGKETRTRETFTGTRAAAEERFFFLKQRLRDGVEVADLSTTPYVRTFGDLLNVYRQNNEITWNGFLFERLENDLGTVRIEDFSLRYDEYVRGMKHERSPRTGRFYSNATINRLTVYTRAIFSYALKRGLIPTNPMILCRKLKEYPRDRVLSDDERKRLFTVLQDNETIRHILPAVQFAIQVPIRRSELVHLTKDLLNVDSMVIKLKHGTTKNGNGTFIPVPPDMAAYFKNIPEQSQYLFYREEGGKFLPLGDFKRAWHRALELACISNFRFHDLRHIAATALIDQGTPVHVVLSIGNWKTDMLRCYYHLDSLALAKQAKFSQKSVQ